MKGSENMKPLFLGIDPGKKGGIAFIDNRTGEIGTKPFGSSALIELLEEARYYESVCCLEKVGAMPGQGVVSMFNFGQNVGYIKGMLEAFCIPYQEISPQRWKKEFGLSSDKEASAEVCRKLFPNINLLATPKCKKPHDGMAEALLMAEYARRKL